MSYEQDSFDPEAEMMYYIPAKQYRKELLWVFFTGMSIGSILTSVATYIVFNQLFPT